MRKKCMPLGLMLAAALLLVLSACSGGRKAAAPRAAGPQPDAAAPAPQTLDLAGLQKRLAGDKGRVALVMFWATWCPACKSELPVLERLRAAYPPEQLDIMAVSVDDDTVSMRAFLTDHPQKTDIFLSKREVGAHYGVSAIPLLVILDKNGSPAFKDAGAYPYEMLNGVVQKLVKAS